MANRGKKTKHIEFIIGLIIFILIAILSESGIILIEEIFNSENSEVLDSNEIPKRVTAEESENVTLEGEDILQIHFFDVGQADSTLIISDNKTMLIDAGTNEMGTKVVANIKKLGIEKIDYLIGTHPHEDHIGGLDDVIKNFEIGTIYMPKVQTNTKTFEDVLDAITEKNLTVTTPKEGDKFELGKGVVLQKGEKVALVATGLMVQEALEAAKKMETAPTVVNIHTIKPIDKELIIELAKTHDTIVTCEEHSIIGGLGSAVAEVLAEAGTACKLVRVGVQDVFGESGKPAQLFAKYKIDADAILEAATK